jgi:hypothetical protein
MNGLEAAVAAFALLMLAAAAVAPAIYARWRSAVVHGSELQIWRVLRSRGIRAEEAAGKEREILVAAHRCSACRSAERCDAWLASGKAEGLEEFCPNYGLMQQLGAGRGAAAGG